MGNLFDPVPHLILAVGRNTPEGVNLLGSCFSVGSNLFATAHHSIGADEKNLVLILPKTERHSDYQDTSDLSVQSVPAGIKEVDPVRDICLLEAEVEINPPYALTTSDNARPGMSIVTFGFPHADHGRLVLTRQDSAVGARVLIESEGINSKHIVLNTQARPGQSGGPVFLPSGDEIVAMLIGSYAPGGGGGISLGGIDPQTLHQTTHAISAEYITKML